MTNKFQISLNFTVHKNNKPGAAYAGDPQQVASGIKMLVPGSEDSPKSIILILYGRKILNNIIYR